MGEPAYAYWLLPLGTCRGAKRGNLTVGAGKGLGKAVRWIRGSTLLQIPGVPLFLLPAVTKL